MASPEWVVRGNSIRRVFGYSMDIEKRFNVWFRLGTRRHSLLVSFLVGVLCGLAAVLLKHTVHWTHSFVLSVTESWYGSFLYLILPGVGVFLTYLIVRYIVRDNIGHGVTRILYAISRHRGRIRLHNTWSSILTSSVTIGFGGSVGAESPVVLTGAAIGSNVARFFKMDSKAMNLMVGCGAAAGVAAIFKAPLAGMVFTLEVLMLDLTLNSIVPLLVSAVSATLVSSFLLGEATLFHFVYNVPFDLAKTPYYLLLGLFTGLVSVYFTRMAMRMEGWFGRMKKHPYQKILLGALMLGVLIFFFPPLYGEGYESVQALFEGKASTLLHNSPLESLADNPWIILLFLLGLLALKVIAMAATTGGGGIGGSFAPTLFVGGVSGFFLCTCLNQGMNAGVGVANFVLVGMSGAMAGVMHAPLLGIFLIAELTGGYALLLPLMITATVAYITSSYFDKHSIYTQRLAAQGDLITHHKDKAVLTMLSLRNVIETDLVAVRPDDSLGQLVKAVAHSHRNIFPVTSPEDELLGILLLDDIRSIMFEADKYDDHFVRDFMSLPPAVVDLEENMSVVMDKFEDSGAWNLPVVHNGRYIGFVSKAKIFSAYRDMLVQFSNE